jgi:hypothetical protein
MADEITADKLQVPEAAQAAALGSLGVFRQLATAPNNTDLIAGGPGAAADLRVGTPVQDSVIKTGELSRWDGKDPKNLIHLTGDVIFPILGGMGDDDVTKSSMTLAQADGKWSAVEFGAVAQAQLRDRFKKQIITEAPGAPDGKLPAVFQVRLPSMNITFLASEEGEHLFFTSLDNIPSIKVKEGEKLTAREVLLRLRPAAQEPPPGAPD